MKISVHFVSDRVTCATNCTMVCFLHFVTEGYTKFPFEVCGKKDIFPCLIKTNTDLTVNGNKSVFFFPAMLIGPFAFYALLVVHGPQIENL